MVKGTDTHMWCMELYMNVHLLLQCSKKLLLLQSGWTILLTPVVYMRAWYSWTRHPS